MGKEAAAALSAAGIPTVSLSAKSRKDAVRVGTMHGMKNRSVRTVPCFAPRPPFLMTIA
jgi:hypothetical protein